MGANLLIVTILTTGSSSVHLVELRSTTEFYAMKAMEKSVMVNRNKVGIRSI